MVRILPRPLGSTVALPSGCRVVRDGAAVAGRVAIGGDEVFGLTPLLEARLVDSGAAVSEPPPPPAVVAESEAEPAPAPVVAEAKKPKKAKRAKKAKKP